MIEEHFIPPYTVLMILSGLYIRKIQSLVVKRNICTFLGVATYFFAFNYLTVIFPLSMILINALSLRLLPKRYMLAMSLVINFSYLSILRFCNQYVFEGLNLTALGENVILFLVLRLVNVAYFVEKNDLADKSVIKHYKFNIFNELSYYFCYCGVMIGPIFSYTTYMDMLQQSRLKIEDGKQPYYKCLPNFLECFKDEMLWVVIMVATFLAVIQVYNVEIYENPAYYGESVGFFTRMFYMWCSATVLRYRLVGAFVFGLWSCRALGMGAYPNSCHTQSFVGPKSAFNSHACSNVKANTENDYKKQINYTTVVNIDIWSVEFGYFYNRIIKSWNINIQRWLTVNVYSECDRMLNRKTGRFFKIFLVYFVSSIWHGIYPGYYMAFSVAPLIILFESLLSSICDVYDEKSFATSSVFSRRYAVCCVIRFILYRTMEYAMVGFIVLKATLCFKVWKASYFYIHATLVGAIVLVLLLKKFFIGKKYIKL